MMSKDGPIRGKNSSSSRNRSSKQIRIVIMVMTAVAQVDEKEEMYNLFHVQWVS
jgi:hypothetical protein